MKKITGRSSIVSSSFKLGQVINIMVSLFQNKTNHKIPLICQVTLDPSCIMPS